MYVMILPLESKRPARTKLRICILYVHDCNVLCDREDHHEFGDVGLGDQRPEG
jgi:hypothetical protein